MLTYVEIATAATERDLDEPDVEELHGFLERTEIELFEEVDPALAAAEVQRAPVKRGRRGRVRPDLEPKMSTDSLQLFLKGVGKVPLLSAPLVEFLRRAHEPDRALLHRIEKRQPLVAVVPRDRDNQPQIGFDDPLRRVKLAPLSELGLLGASTG